MSMRNINSAPQVDWIANTLRWFILLTAALGAAINNGLAWPMIVVLFGAALVTAFFTVLGATGHYTNLYRGLTIIVDLGIAYALLFLSDNLAGSVSWIGILPIVSASLYFRLIGLGSVTALNVLAHVALSVWNNADLMEVAPQIGILAILYLVVGIIFVLVGGRLSSSSTPVKRAGSKNGANGGGVTKEALERQRTVYRLISSLNESLNYERVLETVLDLSAQTLKELGAPVTKLKSAILLFSQVGKSGAELEVTTARNFIPLDIGVRLPGVEGALAITIEDGETHLTKELKEDPELRRLSSLHDCRSGYAIPLRKGLDAYGTLLYAHADPEFFSIERCEVLDIVGNQLVIAIQNARLYQDLASEKERMMEIQEDTRKKMARDLHDGPTQSVSAIAMRVNFARRMLERDVKGASEELFKIEELARRTVKEIRLMLFTLRPLVLESQGLPAALQTMAEKTKETYNQEVIVQADERAVEQLDPGKQAMVFYIADEAVNNARKHAQAPHIWVRLKMLRDGIALLEIEDDGVGFDVKAVDTSYDSRGSLGMVNMRERTELINGVLHIDSSKGHGTRIQIAIPLTQEAVDRLRNGA